MAGIHDDIARMPLGYERGYGGSERCVRGFHGGPSAGGYGFLRSAASAARAPFKMFTIA